MRQRKIISLIIILLLAVTYSYSNPYTISSNVLKNENLNFKPHRNYLCMEINYAPVKEIFNSLSKDIPHKLKTRGEAHITVLTPPEFYNIKDYITIDRINEIALEENIQRSDIDICCIGRGSKNIDNNNEYTYFIVVKSYNLIRIRQRILNEIIKNGGSLSLFDPYEFYSHITLGFTKRDLHLQDGIVKNKTSFFEDIQVISGK